MKPIDRNELLCSKEYWMVKMQSDLIHEVETFMAAKGMNRAQLADYLGYSRGYITQLLSGAYDSKISKIVELALSIGLAPEIHFSPIPLVSSKEAVQSPQPGTLLPAIS
jgi:transcriptional regulator with XRE-family HTH domain